MDVALAFADGLLLDGVYQRVSTVAGWETLARDHLLRQTVSVFAMILYARMCEHVLMSHHIDVKHSQFSIGGFALYLTLASVNFRWWFDARKEFPSDTECFKQVHEEWNICQSLTHGRKRSARNLP